ncbi:IQ calmodulin-binding motif domain-containing protein [Ditylenchus destructor]|uniref:IQ calmodulin-binding motif domain-containing protein n=1 Tax=Ditylenchus destructor TaxID=166010 RepID=A0AAD4R597_9BILA|nr:IQ calmodulin-binding motif domain-containing protein [Ditylenchus destructor]
MTESVTDKYKVPQGLRPLLEAFARETLRVQPNDLFRFGQLFFEVLQQHRRQNPGADVISDQISYEMFRTDLQHKYRVQSEDRENFRPNSPADLAATRIQAAFRGHRVRNHPEKFGIEGIDQLPVGGGRNRRRSNERLQSADYKKDMKRHSVGGYTHMYSTPEDRAATKIQAEIRGFLTRRHVEVEKAKNTEAATKIQAHIRGFLTRKKLEEKGIMLSPSRSRNSLNSTNSADN